MKTSSLLLIVLAVVIVVSIVAVASYPSIQDFMASNTQWNGIREFIDQYQVQQVDSLNRLPEQSAFGTMVVIPYQPLAADDLERLKQYVLSGNTLVLMDDFGYGNDILAYLGLKARFRGELLLDPLFCYKAPGLPRITDFTADVRRAGVDAVVLNNAAVLNNIEGSQVLAWSSSTSFLDLNRNGAQDAGEPVGPFVVAAKITLGRGMVEIVSDPSLIINSMNDQSDNSRFVSYLMESSSTPGPVLLDRSHLSKAPLDQSKIHLETAKQVLSGPYALLGLVALAFALVAVFMLNSELLKK